MTAINFKTVIKNIPETIDRIDYKDIVICGYEHHDVLKQGINNIIIKTTTKENIGLSNSINERTCLFNYYPLIKISTPPNIRIEFIPIINQSYIMNIHRFMDINNTYDDDDNIKNITYTTIRFELCIDIINLRKQNKTASIDKDSDLIFFNIYPYQSDVIDNIYYIKNDEIYNSFEKIF